MRSLFGDGTDSGRIDARLAEIASVLSEPPAWREPLGRLGPEPPLDRRLAVYLAVRGSGVLPEDAGLFLVARVVHEIAESAAETELEPFAAELEAIEAAEGFDRDGWPAGEPPAEYDAVLDRHEAAWCELFARTLAVHAPDLAGLYRADRREFDVRSGTGREFFRGAVDPQWLTRLVAEVAACLKGESMLVRPVARWRADGDGFDVTIFPRPLEIVVGARDGAVVDPGFEIDVVGLQESFERIDALTWIVPVEPGEPPFLAVAGFRAGRRLRLRILPAAPDGVVTAKVGRS